MNSNKNNLNPYFSGYIFFQILFLIYSIKDIHIYSLHNKFYYEHLTYQGYLKFETIEIFAVNFFYPSNKSSVNSHSLFNKCSSNCLAASSFESFIYLKKFFSEVCPVIFIRTYDFAPCKYRFVAKDLLAVCEETQSQSS